MTSAPPAPRPRAVVLAGAVYAAVAVAWAAPSSLSPLDTVPNYGDPLHLGWVMAWDAHQLVRRPWALFESNSFHPYPRSLAFGDHLLPEAVLVAPVLWSTGNAVLAFNVAVVLALAFSALAMFVLLARVTGRGDAAFLAGLWYAFNAFTQSELPRVHVLNLQWWPLAVLFLAHFVRDGRARDGWLFSAALLLQGLSSSYYLLYCALLLPLWLAVAYGAERRLPGRLELRTLGVGFGLAGALAAVLLWPYLVHHRQLGFEKELAPGADLLTLVEPPRFSPLFGGLDLPGAVPEVPHFMGFVGIGLTLAGIVHLVRSRTRRPVVGWLAVATAGVGVVMSLGPVVHVAGSPLMPGPFGLLHRYVPLARAMASPERFAALVVLGAAILVGLGGAAVLAAVRPALAMALTGLLAVLLPLEHWSPPRRPARVPAGRDVPKAFSYVAGAPREPLVHLPLYPERFKARWAAYLNFSTHHWRPIPIGRTSFYPPAHDYLAWSLRGFPDDTSLALLDRIGIRTVIVHPHVWEAGERAQRLEELARTPRLRLRRAFDDLVPARYAELGLGEELVYALEPAPPPPEPCAPADEIPRAGWTFTSTGVKSTERLRDGDRATTWFTERPQRPGDGLDVELSSPETLAAVVLETTYPFDQFPRQLNLALRGMDGRWRRTAWADGPAERRATLDRLLERPREAAEVLRVEPQVVTGARLFVANRPGDPAWPRWSVAELRLYRSCPGPS